MRTKSEKGIALITALLILFLVAAIVVGMSWMVVTDQKLSGNNQDREFAFYGADQVGRITTGGTTTEFRVRTSSHPVEPGWNTGSTEGDGNSIGRISP